MSKHSPRRARRTRRMAFDFQAAASATVGVQRRVVGPRLAEVKAGLLMTFNVTKLKSGIKCFSSSFVLFVSFVVKQILCTQRPWQSSAGRLSISHRSPPSMRLRQSATQKSRRWVDSRSSCRYGLMSDLRDWQRACRTKNRNREGAGSSLLHTQWHTLSLDARAGCRPSSR